MRILSASLAAALLAGCSSLPAQALFGNEVSITQEQLQRSLDRSFPKRYSQLGGLVEMQLSQPRVEVPREGERIRLSFDVDVDGYGPMGRPDGRVVMSSALRFDPQTRGLHLVQPTVDSADLAGFGPLQGNARSVINTAFAAAADEEPVHRFEGSALERLASRRIDTVRVDNGRIVLDMGQ